MLRPLTVSQRNVLARASRVFHEALPGSVADEYLTERGFDQDSKERARLGYVAEELPGFERFAGMLAIPNICASGFAVGMKFRRIPPYPDGANKYDQPSQPTRAYNLRALNTPSDLIVITEGELDAIMVEQLGFPAVGVPGTNGWKPHYPRMFEDYDRVVVVRDPDEAGKIMAESVRRSDLPVEVVVPAHGDVGETVLAGGADALVAAIRGEVD